MLTSTNQSYVAVAVILGSIPVSERLAIGLTMAWLGSWALWILWTLVICAREQDRATREER
jgi:hypothetical protein